MKLTPSIAVRGEINAKVLMATIFYTLLDPKEILEIIADTIQINSLEEWHLRRISA